MMTSIVKTLNCLTSLVLRVRQALSSSRGITRLKPAINVALFSLLLCYGIFRHELWGDELQAWMLARESSSIGELIQNTKYEGHPILWHLLLWAVTRFSFNPGWMQLLNWLIAIGTVCLVSFLAPFRKGQNILLTFSYFVFYEYAVISRCYGLGVFLAFLFCSVSVHEHSQNGFIQAKFFDCDIWVKVLLLVALANTSAYGLILSIALSFTLWDEQIGLRKTASKKLPLLFLNSCLLAGWLLSGWQIVRAFKLESMRQVVTADSFVLHEPVLKTVQPASEFALASFNIDTEHLLRISRLVAYVWKSYVPLPEIGNVAFWNTSLFSENSIGLLALSIPGLGGVNVGQILSVLLSVFFLSYVPLYCLHRPMVKTAYCVGNTLLLILTYLLMPTAIRHYGHFFILFVVCAWLDATPPCLPESKTLASMFKRRTALILTSLLFVQTCVGFYAYTLDCFYPFSGGRDASQFIKQHKLEHLPIVTSSPWPTSVFSGYLNRDVYYIDLQKYGSFITPRRGDESYEDAVAEIRHLLYSKGKIMVILDLKQSVDRLASALLAEGSKAKPLNFEIKFLTEFEGKIEPSDSYLLYVLELA